MHNHPLSNLLFTRHIFLCLFATLILGACQTIDHRKTWPPELPDQALFIQGFLEKRQVASASDAQLNYHLGWIKKFYLGTRLYPHGWLSASNQYLSSMTQSEPEQEALRLRLSALGVAIANEWAQDNDVRLITNTNIATWASAMRTAAQRHEHEMFITKVEQDVQHLLEKTITAKDIQYERYFEEEVFDDF